ncbi:MAG: phosphonate metabolism transcriptional regulator PhnF [Pseudomonadota bacterium]
MSAPIWQEIRESVAGDIAKGRYPPASKLPSEADLAARFGVNRHTVRRALADLSDAGLVHARRGAGVFVTSQTIAYRLGRRTRFTQNLREAGHIGTRRILRLETLPATAEDATRLNIPKGAPVHVTETVSLIDAVPAMYSRGLFPAEPLAAFPQTFRETGSITEALAACDIADYRRAWTRLTAERARAEIARHLQVTDGAPLMRTVSQNVTPNGTPIEFARTWICADRVELLIEDDTAP